MDQILGKFLVEWNAYVGFEFEAVKVVLEMLDGVWGD